MRDANNIRQLDEAKIADWMGFIFFKKSSRNVDTLPGYMPKNSKRVGVFVNEPMEGVIERVNTYGFNLVQLHGHETPAYIENLKVSLPKDVQIIKMIQISNIDDIKAITQYEGLADYFLFETKCEGYGGSGKQFDWQILDEYKGSTPFILTGGIGAEDVDKVKAFSHPQFAGIDLNSKFEASPAFKDIELLKNFIKQLR